MATVKNQPSFGYTGKNSARLDDAPNSRICVLPVLSRADEYGKGLSALLDVVARYYSGRERALTIIFSLHLCR